MKGIIISFRKMANWLTSLFLWLTTCPCHINYDRGHFNFNLSSNEFNPEFEAPFWKAALLYLKKKSPFVNFSSLPLHMRSSPFSSSLELSSSLLPPSPLSFIEGDGCADNDKSGYAVHRKQSVDDTWSDGSTADTASDTDENVNCDIYRLYQWFDERYGTKHKMLEYGEGWVINDQLNGDDRVFAGGMDTFAPTGDAPHSEFHHLCQNQQLQHQQQKLHQSHPDYQHHPHSEMGDGWWGFGNHHTPPKSVWPENIVPSFEEAASSVSAVQYPRSGSSAAGDIRDLRSHQYHFSKKFIDFLMTAGLKHLERGKCRPGIVNGGSASTDSASKRGGDSTTKYGDGGSSRGDDCSDGVIGTDVGAQAKADDCDGIDRYRTEKDNGNPNEGRSANSIPSDPAHNTTSHGESSRINEEKHGGGSHTLRQDSGDPIVHNLYDTLDGDGQDEDDESALNDINERGLLLGCLYWLASRSSVFWPIIQAIETYRFSCVSQTSKSIYRRIEKRAYINLSFPSYIGIVYVVLGMAITNGLGFAFSLIANPDSKSGNCIRGEGEDEAGDSEHQGLHVHRRADNHQHHDGLRQHVVRHQDATLLESDKDDNLPFSDTNGRHILSKSGRCGSHNFADGARHMRRELYGRRDGHAHECAGVDDDDHRRCRDTDGNHCHEHVHEHRRNGDTGETPDDLLDTLDDTVDTLDDTVDTLDDTVDTPDDTADTPDDTADTRDDTVDTPDDTADTRDDTVDTPDDTADTRDDTVDTPDGTVDPPDDEKLTSSTTEATPSSASVSSLCSSPSSVSLHPSPCTSSSSSALSPSVSLSSSTSPSSSSSPPPSSKSSTRPSRSPISSRASSPSPMGPISSFVDFTFSSTSSLSPHQSLEVKHFSFLRFLREFYTTIFPMVIMLLVPTTYTGALLLLLSTIFFLSAYQGGKNYNMDLAGLFKERSPNVESKTGFLHFVSDYRAHIMITTCVAILAVDFLAFPRDYAKTDEYGISLMDVGVGSFVFSSGFVSRYARGVKESFKSRLLSLSRSTWMLFFIGIARFMAMRYFELYVVPTEYGLHWNFFLTLCVVGLVTSLSVDVIFQTEFCLFVGILVGLLYQIYLSVFGMDHWMSTAERRDFLSSNREGIFGSIGFVSLSLISTGLGRRFFLNFPSVTRCSRRRMKSDSVGEVIMMNDDGVKKLNGRMDEMHGIDEREEGKMGSVGVKRGFLGGNGDSACPTVGFCGVGESLHGNNGGGLYRSNDGDADQLHNGDADHYHYGDADPLHNGNEYQHHNGDADQHHNGDADQHHNGDADQHHYGDADPHHNGDVDPHHNGDADRHRDGDADQHRDGNVIQHCDGNVVQHHQGNVDQHEYDGGDRCYVGESHFDYFDANRLSNADDPDGQNLSNTDEFSDQEGIIDGDVGHHVGSVGEDGIDDVEELNLAVEGGNPFTSLQAALFLLKDSFMAYLGACLLEHVFNLKASRRMINLPWVLWICHLNLIALCFFCVVDSFLNKRKTVHIVRGIQSNQLVIFVVSNLLTGLVNNFFQTLLQPPLVAVLLVTVYGTAWGLVAYVFSNYDLKVKLL